MRNWTRWNLDAVFLQRLLEDLSEVGELLNNQLQRAKEVLILDLLDLTKNLEVLLRVLEVLSANSAHIVKLGLQRLLSTRHLVHLLSDLLLDPLPLIVHLVTLLSQLLLLCLDLHEPSCILIVVLLQLLQLATLLKQCL